MVRHMGSYLQERGPFLSGENYSLDRCPLMGASEAFQVRLKIYHYRQKESVMTSPLASKPRVGFVSQVGKH